MMKKCVSCGAEMEDRCNFCPNCGEKCGDGETLGFPDDGTGEASSVCRENRYPMKWHKFLMVVMIISAVLTVINGMGLLSGITYKTWDLDAEIFYETYPGMKACDIFYGIALISVGVFQVIVRNRLKQFCRNAPLSMQVMYGLAIASGLIYMLWASYAVGISMFDSSYMGSVGSSAVLLIINSIYYSKRKDLFVN